MEELTRLIREDMKPALGVTEPGAIAFAVASAKKHTSGEVKHVKVALNSGMYKNAFTCGIPGSTRYVYTAASEVSSPVMPKAEPSSPFAFSSALWGAWSVMMQSMVPSFIPFTSSSLSSALLMGGFIFQAPDSLRSISVYIR